MLEGVLLDHVGYNSGENTGLSRSWRSLHQSDSLLDSIKNRCALAFVELWHSIVLHIEHQFVIFESVSGFCAHQKASSDSSLVLVKVFFFFQVGFDGSLLIFSLLGVVNDSETEDVLVFNVMLGHILLFPFVERVFDVDLECHSEHVVVRSDSHLFNRAETLVKLLVMKVINSHDWDHNTESNLRTDVLLVGLGDAHLDSAVNL